MREVVYDHQVVLVPRDAGHRRGPQVTVNEIKEVNRVGGGSGERKTNVATQLARMAEMLNSSRRARDSRGTTKLSQGVAARVTKATVPSGGRSGGEESRRGRGRR